VIFALARGSRKRGFSRGSQERAFA
jgi:hypothetical protein